MQEYDRTAEDLGNIVGLEHVNVRVPDQRLATLYYITGLGLTRDPYLMTGVTNMWANVGRSQFHLPTGAPQVVRGITALVLPDREALLRRLAAVRPHLEGTHFAFRETEDAVETICPWGNRVRCHAPDHRFGPYNLAMPYVELEVPPGTAEGIAAFYRTVMGAPATVQDTLTGRQAQVEVGRHQQLRYRETDAPAPAYDGHHVQVYLANFSRPHRRLLEMGLITEESDQHQYRFVELRDPRDGQSLFALEHEVRSMRHPLYARPLVNRDPAQSNVHFTPGAESWHWHL